MKILRKTQLLTDSPPSATGDIAFNLLIFFLVCAASPSDRGRTQDIPRSESKQQQSEQSQNLEVKLTRTTITITPPLEVVRPDLFKDRIKALLKEKTRPEDRIVIVKSDKDTPYQFWIQVTSWVEQAGGTVTLQLEEEREVMVP